MADRIVQLKDKDDNNIYPVASVPNGAKITMTNVDPGEGSPLAADNYIAVYGGSIPFGVLGAMSVIGTSGDTIIAANTNLNLTDLVGQIGSKLTQSSGGIKIGAGITKVLVSGEVFYTGTGTNAYGWCQIVKDTTPVGGRVIANISNSSYGSATTPQLVLDVQEGDTIYLKNVDPATVRLNSSMLTVVAIG